MFQKRFLFSLFSLIITLSLFMAGCDGFKWPWQKNTTSSWSESQPKASTTVPWNNQAIATNTFINIAQIADPGVVNIGSTQVIKRSRRAPGLSPFENFFGDDLFKDFFGEAPKEEIEKRPSLGSGFILTEDGLIVTNNHVIEKASEITVTIGKDTEYKAKVVGADPKTDVALIKINPKEKLKPLELGDSDILQVGEIVVAIGNPFGLSHTVTQGIVSAKERTTIGAGPYDNFIQTDASINPGNSGGPLLNLEAKVIGINTAIVAGGQGIGFAIPINLAKNIVKQLQEKGSVTRGWLGVYIQEIDPELAKNLGLENKRGALVANVQKNSPAEKAGFKKRDVIVKVDNKEILKSAELPIYIANLPVGKKISVTIIRDGKKKIITAILGELKNTDENNEARPQGQSEEDEKVSFDRLGLMVQDNKEGEKGVRVTAVDPSSLASEKGIRRGELIVEINQSDIQNKAAYDNLLKNLEKGKSVMLRVESAEAGPRYLAFDVVK